jgi:hypothetical protein
VKWQEIYEKLNINKKKKKVWSRDAMGWFAKSHIWARKN